MKNPALLLLTAALLSTTLFTQNAHADAGPQINWGAPQNIGAGDSDISTLGSLLYAYNIGASGVAGTTVYGVPFTAFVFPNLSSNTATVGDVTFTESPGYLDSSNNLGWHVGGFDSLSSEYQVLLGSGGFANNPTTISVSLGGLVSGQDYLVQWWSNDSRFDFTFSQTTATGDPSSVTLDSNLSNNPGGLGQFVIGTFTALGPSTTFELEGIDGGLPLINAIQVRNITSAAVPEPGQAAASLLLLAGIAGYVWLKRRKPAKAEAPAA